MAAAVTVNDVLDGHVVLDVECLDRIYLDGHVCCRALKLATTPSLPMHMRNDVVRRDDDSVLATMTATPRVAPPPRHRCTR